jgi:hypothetical protein
MGIGVGVRGHDVRASSTFVRLNVDRAVGSRKAVRRRMLEEESQRNNNQGKNTGKSITRNDGSSHANLPLQTEPMMLSSANDAYRQQERQNRIQSLQS